MSSLLTETLSINMSSPLTIEGVKTALKIGTCVLDASDYNRLWTMNWDQQYKEKIADNAGRIYLIVSRLPSSSNALAPGIIKKIGKSECRGGMKSTFSFYQGGLGGSPSIRTFGIHHLIAEELKTGNDVEIWGIWSAPVAALVPGLFDTIELFVTPSIHTMEERCRNDYKAIMNDYPPWNFQERAKAWPENINILYKQQVANRYTEEQREAIVKRRALRNYERFHGKLPGSACLDDVVASSAGLTGWAKASSKKKTNQPKLKI